MGTREDEFKAGLEDAAAAMNKRPDWEKQATAAERGEPPDRPRESGVPLLPSIGLLMERIAVLEDGLERLRQRDAPVGGVWAEPIGEWATMRLETPLADPTPFHPLGRCTCVGEGRCTWCRVFGGEPVDLTGPDVTPEVRRWAEARTERNKCPHCPHPAHRGMCTGRNGQTAHPCPCYHSS